MKAMPIAAGSRPRTRVRFSAPYLIEYDGPENGWVLVGHDGRKMNPPILTAAAFALYLKRKQLGRLVENLEALDNPTLEQIATAKY